MTTVFHSFIHRVETTGVHCENPACSCMPSVKQSRLFRLIFSSVHSWNKPFKVFSQERVNRLKHNAFQSMITQQSLLKRLKNNIHVKNLNLLIATYSNIPNHHKALTKMSPWHHKTATMRNSYIRPKHIYNLYKKLTDTNKRESIMLALTALNCLQVHF